MTMNKASRSFDDGKLFKACYGLVFFDVPNLGLRYEALLTMVESQDSRQLIEALVTDKNSKATPLLMELGKKFFKCCEAQDFRIISFYERLKSVTLKVSTDMFVDISSL